MTLSFISDPALFWLWKKYSDISAACFFCAAQEGLMVSSAEEPSAPCTESEDHLSKVAITQDRPTEQAPEPQDL